MARPLNASTTVNEQVITKEHRNTMVKVVLSSFFAVACLQPAAAQRKYNKVATEPKAIITVRVEGGSFDLGADDEAADRKPAHTVKLKDFYMGAYEVKQDQWEAIMGDNPSFYPCGECPVTNVSYTDVLAFIEKLNSTTGKHYRLPTEAEWEYAARGGATEDLIKESHARGGVNEFLIAEDKKGLRTPEQEKKGKQYAGKRGVQPVAWYSNNAEDHVHPVGRKQPNELGIYDMSGNVEEWCSDWYATTYGSKNAVENPQGPAGGRAHVVRGGSYASTANEVIVTRRAAYTPDIKAMSLGFRLVEDK